MNEIEKFSHYLSNKIGLSGIVDELDKITTNIMIFATVAPTPQHLRYTSSTEPTPLFQSSAITRRNPPTSGSGKETQKSLSEITQAFLKYIRNAPNPEIIDLSDFCNR